MLRHIQHHRVYWFCRSCWQEMPVLDRLTLGIKQEAAEIRPEATYQPTLMSCHLFNSHLIKSLEMVEMNALLIS